MSITLSPLAAAVANAENGGRLTNWYNNPGNLKIGDVGSGTLPNGITIFGTLQDGATALENQLSKMVNGGSSVYSPSQSLSSAGATYSGSTNGNWASNVASALGVSPSTSLSSLSQYLGGSGSSVLGSLTNMGNVAGLLGGGSKSVSSLIFGVSLEDAVCIVIGLLFIAGAVYSFKQTSTVVQTGINVAGHVKRVAKLAAEAA